MARGHLLALTMLPDLCHLLPSPEAWKQFGACTWCHGVCLSGDQVHRLGFGAPTCSPMPHSPEECRCHRTCSECLACHPWTLQPGDGEASVPRCKWCNNCPEGACIGHTSPASQRMTDGSVSERSSRQGTAQRLCVGLPTASSVPGRASECEHGSSRGQGRPTSDLRDSCILSMQPTYDWTCFSHSAGYVPNASGIITLTLLPHSLSPPA